MKFLFLVFILASCAKLSTTKPIDMKCYDPATAFEAVSSTGEKRSCY